MGETVTISKEDYDIMQMCVSVLDALRLAGVDKWEGFDGAMKTLVEPVE